MNSAFKPVHWSHNTNIYEVNLRQYTPEGTFTAFATHLPRLKDMGVKTLWFMPIHPIGVLNRKGSLGSYYSISDYTEINSEYGNKDDFKKMVEQAHEMDFKIMLDWVANHCAWDNVWTKTHPDFFKKDERGNFVPPFPSWEDVIKLDYDNEEMRAAMREAMKYWVKEFDIDGYRCDMAHLVPLDFWRAARDEVDAMKPLFWLAETEEINYHEVFDASYTWEFLHTMEKFWRKETNLKGLDDVLAQYNFLFPKNSMRIYFTSNHDENSHSGSEYERMGDAAKAFAVLCATWHGIPLVYSGQELPNHKRLLFFDKDQIDWAQENQLHDFYKTLLHLHSRNSALRAGDDNSLTIRLKTSADDRLFSFLRKNGENEVLVILNLSPEPAEFYFNSEVTGLFKEIFTGHEKDFTSEKNILIDPWKYFVFEK